jgi:hypothetical protein
MAVRSNILFSVPIGAFGLPVATWTTIYETPVGHLTILKGVNVVMFGTQTLELGVQASLTDPITHLFQFTSGSGARVENLEYFVCLPEGFLLRANDSAAGGSSMYGSGAELVL